MKRQKTILLVLDLAISLFMACFFLCACGKNPAAPGNTTYETPYGSVTKVDEYPLFTIHYSSDYQFEEYLRTGRIPVYASDLSGVPDFACTCFSAFGGDYRLLCRNYDWPESSTYYLVFTDPAQGYASVSMVDMSFFTYNHDEPPDFSGNLNALRLLPYRPFDGMNEKGVAVGMNAVPEAESPFDASKVTIGELQMIRLVLDYAASADEAVALIRQYNIRMEDPPIHYLIADLSGHSVIVEFVNGKMEIIENTDPWQVTTNFIVTGLNDPQDAPCWRYREAYSALSRNNGSLTESGAVHLLQDVSMETTRWSTVFHLRSRKIHVAMGRKYNELYFFDF